jgi:hypothetical protein
VDSFPAIFAFAVDGAFAARLVVEPADVVVEIPAAAIEPVEGEPGVGVADAVAVEPPVRGVIFGFEHVVAREGEFVVVHFHVGVQLAPHVRLEAHLAGDVHSHAVEDVVDLLRRTMTAGDVERRE